MNKLPLFILAFFSLVSTAASAQDSLKLKTVEMVIKGKTFRGVRSAKGQTLFIDLKSKTISHLSGDARIKDDVYGIETIERKVDVTTYACHAISDTRIVPQLISIDEAKRRIRFQPKNINSVLDSPDSYVEYFY